METSALAHNIHFMRERLPEGIGFCAVLKGDAYGHGLAGVRDFLADAGLVDMAAVGRLSEFAKLCQREDCGGVDTLLIGAVEAGELAGALQEGKILPERMILSVFNLGHFRALEALARERQIPLRVHLRVDEWSSGMGLSYEEFRWHEEEFFSSPWIRTEGLYSHLYCSYSGDKERIRRELGIFSDFVRSIRPEHRSRLLVHVLNSPLVLPFADYAFDMVRVGTAMYGLPMTKEWDLRRAMHICARVFSVHTIDARTPLSYQSGTEPGMRRIARIMLGYWDAPFLLMGRDVRVRIRDRVFPLADEVCMDNLCVDVTGMEEVTAGDKAVLLNAPGLWYEEIMERNGIPITRSEQLCMTAERLEKEYL